VTCVSDAFTDNWISVALVQLGPDAEDVALGTELTDTPVSLDPPVTLNTPSSCCSLLPALFSATIWMEYSPEGMPRAGRLQEEA